MSKSNNKSRSSRSSGSGGSGRTSGGSRSSSSRSSSSRSSSSRSSSPNRSSSANRSSSSNRNNTRASSRPRSTQGSNKRRAPEPAPNNRRRTGRPPRNDRPPKRGGISPATIALVVLIVLALAISNVISSRGQNESTSSASSSASSSAISSDNTAEDEELEYIEFTPTTDALDEVPTGDGVQTFSLSNATEPELSDEQLTAIEEAIASIETTADVGFVFYDLDTGRGICYNADEAIYGASSFKAPYALYLCESLIETGTISRDSVSSLITAAVVNSDNDSFVSLRDTYDSAGFDEWVTEVGATDATYLSYSHYPWYCARSSAKLWTEMYLYLQTGSDTATWLEGLLGQTTTSFIRNAVDDTGATVLNKAGWYSSTDSSYNSVSDAAIIELDGHTYVLSVMTSLPYSSDTQALHETLSAAIFDVREALISEDGLV